MVLACPLCLSLHAFQPAAKQLTHFVHQARRVAVLPCLKQAQVMR